MPNFLKNIFRLSNLKNNVSATGNNTNSNHYLSKDGLNLLLEKIAIKMNFLDIIYPRGIIIELKENINPSIVIGGEWKDVTETLNSSIRKYQRIIPVNSNKNSLLTAYNNYKSLNKEDYTEASWTQFETALKNVKAVLDDPEATQEQVDSANNALTIAYLTLRKKI